MIIKVLIFKLIFFQFIGSYGFRPFGFNAQLLKKRSVIKSLPALFAPLLFDSPCISTEREKFGEQNETLRVCMLDKFSVEVFNKVVNKYLSPLIDSNFEDDPNAGFGNEELSNILVTLIKNHTDYRHLIDNKIFQPSALVQLMFGNLTSGLRQQAVRKILAQALFHKPLEQLAATLDSLKGGIVPLASPTSRNKRKIREKSGVTIGDWQEATWTDMDNTASTGDSALTASSLSDTVAQDDSEIPSVVAFSEPELR